MPASGHVQVKIMAAKQAQLRQRSDRAWLWSLKLAMAGRFERAVAMMRVSRMLDDRAFRYGAGDVEAWMR